MLYRAGSFKRHDFVTKTGFEFLHDDHELYWEGIASANNTRLHSSDQLSWILAIGITDDECLVNSLPLIGPVKFLKIRWELFHQ